MGGVMGTEYLLKKMKEFCSGDEDLYKKAVDIFEYGEKNEGEPALVKRMQQKIDKIFELADEEKQEGENENEIS